MNSSEKNALATKLYGQEQFAEALDLVDELTRSNYPPAFLMKGFIHEFRDDAEKDYESARTSYVQAAILLRDPRIDIHLARINMKLGNFDKAKSFTDSAMASRLFPDAWFLAGDMFSKALSLDSDLVGKRDLKLAAKYYLKAAFKGRINAMIRYKAIQMRLGHDFSVLLASLALVVLGPIARMLLGQRAYYKY